MKFNAMLDPRLRALLSGINLVRIAEGVAAPEFKG